MIMENYMQEHVGIMPDFSDMNLTTTEYRENELKYVVLVKNFNGGNFDYSRSMELYADASNIKGVYEDELEEVIRQATKFLGIGEEEFMVCASRETFESTIDSLFFTQKGVLATEEMSEKIFYTLMVSSFTNRYLYLTIAIQHLFDIVEFLEQRI